jgi:uncharacterized protein
MKHSGSADLPLYRGPVPYWLANRMAKLALAITEAILQEKGRAEFIKRLSDPFWFQSFGAVLGMDWNSSGVTTSVMNALKKSINPLSQELGLYICGGKGKQSLQTPQELIAVGDRTGLDGMYLAHCSKLSAKVDNTALQDGFQLYLHSFVVSSDGDWSVVQQGMNTALPAAMARRYHWHSGHLQSFVEEPHTAICGVSQGEILNLVAKESAPSRSAIVEIAHERPEETLQTMRQFTGEYASNEAQRVMTLPSYCDVRFADIDMKRLAAVLHVAHQQQLNTFEDILLLKGLGPRTLQSLALVSEVIHGTPSRFTDPARFSFAHGGKGGRPFPVPLNVYDETISTLTSSVEQAKIGHTDKQEALKKLSMLVVQAEKNFIADSSSLQEEQFEHLLQHERKESWRYGGRTVHDDRTYSQYKGQLRMF